MCDIYGEIDGRIDRWNKIQFWISPWSKSARFLHNPSMTEQRPFIDQPTNKWTNRWMGRWTNRLTDKATSRFVCPRYKKISVTHQVGHEHYHISLEIGTLRRVNWETRKRWSLVEIALPHCNCRFLFSLQSGNEKWANLFEGDEKVDFVWTRAVSRCCWLGCGRGGSWRGSWWRWWVWRGWWAAEKKAEDVNDESSEEWTNGQIQKLAQEHSNGFGDITLSEFKIWNWMDVHCHCHFY